MDGRLLHNMSAPRRSAVIVGGRWTQRPAREVSAAAWLPEGGSRFLRALCERVGLTPPSTEDEAEALLARETAALLTARAAPAAALVVERADREEL